jgi:glycosyltransferase involved in cell wall biosynthesis
MRARLLADVGGKPDSVLLLYAGRVSPEKNIGLLVEAMREVAADTSRDYRLVVVGDGPQVAWLEAQFRGALAGRMLHRGAVDRETLATYCASCDVFVHPNPREPFGIGPLEAMASEVPVVMPPAGGVLEYANPLNAWLAQPLAVPFARAIRSAACGSARRLAAARATARRFCWSDVSRRFFATYDDIHRSVMAAQALDPATLSSCPRPEGSAGGSIRMSTL